MTNGIKPDGGVLPGQAWTHRATGNRYTVVALVQMKKRADWYHGVLYRPFAPPPEAEGVQYVRQLSEFIERFDKVTT